jgi:O-glycosyl hydrolase
LASFGKSAQYKVNTRLTSFGLFRILQQWLIVTVSTGWLIALSAQAPTTGASNVSGIPVQLPEWRPHTVVKMQSFEFNPSSRLESNWGDRGRQLRRVFFEEWLPAIFERTLAIEEFEVKDGALEWIFTGEQGGFTVRIEAEKLQILQRYYDSPGLSDAQTAGNSPARRHPERVWLESTVPFRGSIQAVTVSLDHKLGLSVALNGKEVVRHHCLLDVSRHQLAYLAEPGTLGRVRGFLEQTPTGETGVEVNPSHRHQTMLGFGGITTPTAYTLLSSVGKRRWWELLAQYNLLLHREYPMGVQLSLDMQNWDLLADATPHYYGDNFPNGEVSDFAYLRTIRRIGGRVLFEFWQLPSWAVQDWKDDEGKLHSGVAQPEVFARAIVRYCQVSKDRAGAPPDIVGIQNERAQPPQIWREMTLRLREELERAGFRSVKVQMEDAAFVAQGIKSVEAFRQSSQAWAAIDYAAVHMYDYQKSFFDPDAFDGTLLEWHRSIGGKPFLSTEMSVNLDPYQVRSYRLALAMGQLYHKNLTLADASALFYCWLLLNVEQPSYGWTRSLFVPDPANGFVPKPSSYQLRVFGAYSRRIREGMVRLEAKTSNPEVLATAFEGDGGGRTLVLLNRSCHAQRIHVDWQGQAFRFAELVDPYHENSVIPPPDIHSMTVEPGALVTLSTVELGKLSDPLSD